MQQSRPAWLEAKEKNNVRFTDNILTMSHQMRGLVESLLELARVDNGALQKMAPEHVDFTELVRNELLTFEAVFYERDLKLTDELAEGLSVNGSPAHLRQVIEILLDNAQKYCDPKGTVHVELKKKDTHHLLFSVSDPGAPISEEDQEKHL
jgi:signal transduction histidine kinase